MNVKKADVLRKKINKQFEVLRKIVMDEKKKGNGFMANIANAVKIEF